MIHVQVQDRRHLELPEFLGFKTYCPRRQVQMPSNLDQRVQGRAVQRNEMLAPKRVQVDAMAIKTRNHGETRQAAFGGLRLNDDG